jgi:hypothetical protein
LKLISKHKCRKATRLSLSHAYDIKSSDVYTHVHDVLRPKDDEADEANEYLPMPDSEVWPKTEHEEGQAGGHCSSETRELMRVR